MNCKNCGVQIGSSDKTCYNCGVKNPAQVSSQTVSGSVASKHAAKHKKTPKNWPKILLIIIAIIGVSVFFTAIFSTDSDSDYNYDQGFNSDSNLVAGSFESDLASTLPREITSYVWYEDESVHELVVKNLYVERHSENGIYDTADCIIELEDSYMQMTVYATLNSQKYDTGWVVYSWDETQDPKLVAKVSPDTTKLQAEAKGDLYKSFTTVTDELDLTAGTYNYVCSVNDIYTYISYSGTISLTSVFERIGYNRVEELNEYGWNYSVTDDITAEWNISGKWKVEEYYNTLSSYWTLNIQSVDNIPVSDAGTLTWSGNYTGYDVRSYKPWNWSTNDYEDYFVDEETNYNGTYEVENMYNPAEVVLIIRGPSGFGLAVYADKAVGYTDIGWRINSNSEEGVLSYSKY